MSWKSRTKDEKWGTMETAKGGPGEPDKIGRSEGRELLSRPYTSPIAARELALTEDC